MTSENMFAWLSQKKGEAAAKDDPDEKKPQPKEGWRAIHQKSEKPLTGERKGKDLVPRDHREELEWLVGRAENLRQNR